MRSILEKPWTLMLMSMPQNKTISNLLHVYQWAPIIWNLLRKNHAFYAAYKINVGMRLKKASFLTLYCISVYKCISIYHQCCAKHANAITRKQEELTGAIVSGLIFEETIASIITFLINSLQRNSTYFCKYMFFAWDILMINSRLGALLLWTPSEYCT